MFFSALFSISVASTLVLSNNSSVCNQNLDHLNGQQNASIPLYANKGAAICMKELGCFNFTDDFYHPIYRPYNFMPNDRMIINTQFHLFTRNNPKEPIILKSNDLSGIKRSAVNAELPTKFIIHGFLDNRLYGKWMDVLKDDLLLHSSANVFLVDWSGGNSLPYSQAAVNTRVVGAEIALMIKTLQKVKGVSPVDCHIIGHSLGAHAGGYAGKLLENLGRISAVDPAEPFFQYMPPTVRVDRSDANFVDVIHTDSKTILILGLGMSQAVGHVDFYPNDGKNQPGCKSDVIRSVFLEGLFDATRRFVACNHQRAVDFYTYSINYRKALPVAYECSSWSDYKDGRCGDCGRNGQKCAIMGLQANAYEPFINNSHSVKMYISTSGIAPYWVFHYHVTIKFSKPKKTFVDQEGTLIIHINGDENSVKLKLTPSSIDLYHGATYRFLSTNGKRIGSIKNVAFMWESSSWNFFKTKTLHLDFIKITPMNMIDKMERKNNERKFCAKYEKPVKANTLTLLSTLCE